MPDKSKWLKECQRVLKPGGRLLIATWVHRETGLLTCDHTKNTNLNEKERRCMLCCSGFVMTSRSPQHYRPNQRRSSWTLNITDPLPLPLPLPLSNTITVSIAKRLGVGRRGWRFLFSLRTCSLLSKISRYYALPSWVELSDYVAIAQQQGYKSVRTDDWTSCVGPFWPAVWRSVLSWRGFVGLLASLSKGLTLIRGARAVLLMVRGFGKGLIRFGLISCVK